jgi:tetratricopeptide (TPR) repeat protein
VDSTYAEAVNNAGYMYYKMNKHEEAIYWYKKTILLDDKRAVAWLNLGGAYLAIRAYPEAEAAFRKYLDLQPGSRVSVTVREKLAGIYEEMKH